MPRLSQFQSPTSPSNLSSNALFTYVSSFCCPVFGGQCFLFSPLIFFLPLPFALMCPNPAPRSRPCSLEEQYFKCGIFRDYDAPQRRVSNSEAPVLAGGIPVFLRGSQFSGASELKEGAGEQIKVHQHSKAPIVLFLQLYN